MGKKGAGRPKTVPPDGAKIADLRLRAGFKSQFDLHLASGVSLHKISDMERGIETSLPILDKIARSIGAGDGTSLIKRDEQPPCDCPLRAKCLGDIGRFQLIDKAVLEAAFTAVLQRTLRGFLDSIDSGSVILNFKLDRPTLHAMVGAFLQGRLQGCGVYRIEFATPQDDSIAHELNQYIRPSHVDYVFSAFFNAVTENTEQRQRMNRDDRFIEIRAAPSLTRLSSVMQWVIESSLLPSDIESAERLLVSNWATA